MHPHLAGEDYEGGCYTLVPGTKRVDPTIVSIPPTGEYNPISETRMSMIMTMSLREFLDSQDYSENAHERLMALHRIAVLLL